MLHFAFFFFLLYIHLKENKTTSLVSLAECHAFVETRDDLVPDFPPLEGEELYHAKIMRALHRKLGSRS